MLFVSTTVTGSNAFPAPWWEIPRMTERTTLAEIRERTYKRRDAWWTVWLVDPLASRLVWLVAPWRWVTPNRITVGAFVLGAGAAACFWQQSYWWLFAGAVLFHLSFVLDCMDGKIARLNGTGSVFGSWLDYVFDRLRVLVCTIGLFGGQYERTHDFVYVWLAGAVIFLDMFRYLNALQMGQVKTKMKEQLAEAALSAQPEMPTLATTEAAVEAAAEAIDDDDEGDDEPATTYTGDDPALDVHGDFKERFSLFVRIRNFLLGQRIRVHVISGIEFMMFVFIVGPIIGQIVITTIVISVLFVGFELLLIYKLWTTTKTFAKRLARLQAQAAEREAEAEVLSTATA
jgi:phosphatidylglycerophosphate synthase